MTTNPNTLPDILKGTQIRPVFGSGAIDRLGLLAQELGAKRVLIVTDPGIVAAGHANRAEQSLHDAGIQTLIFDAVEENPTTHHVAAGTEAAREFHTDFLVGIGGGSAMDCTKGVNFIYTNGGEMRAYWGVNKAAHSMLPMIAVPTTAGTGSEAQSFALITNPDTHQKMACGDKKAACRIAILDPDLTRTVPRPVAAATGIDAVAHAIETAACTQRNQDSRALSREAWTRLDRAFETAY
ncbi:MAG: iron-containing alcohol dehydrogenase, partial [Phycisphaerae bacterium]